MKATIAVLFVLAAGFVCAAEGVQSSLAEQAKKIIPQPPPEPHDEGWRDSKVVKFVTLVPGMANGGPIMRTVRHDGHLWVMAKGDGMDIEHHPDCQCGRIK